MIAVPAPESDREFFLDRRRELRFRPAMSGEPRGWAVLVHRDGRRWGWPVPSAAAFDLNSNPAALEVLHGAVTARPGLEMETAAVV